MRVLAVCRGGPGLGRVVPSLGLIQSLRLDRPIEAIFASYAAGYSYLRAVGEQVVDLGSPPNGFIDAVAPQAVEIEGLVGETQPELILIDGEFFLPVSLAHFGVPLVYLANPHDLLGPSNTFRRVNRLLLSYCNAVIVSSLACNRARIVDDLVPEVPCFEVPPVMKVFRVEHRPVHGQPRVLVSLGGGSVSAHPNFRASTDSALSAIIDVLTRLRLGGKISSASIVLGADARAIPDQPCEWLTVLSGPVELTTMYADHEVFVSRAGRNACAEAAYTGITTVVIPITSDPNRGAEQADNGDVAAAIESMFLCKEWRDPLALERSLEAAVAHATVSVRKPGLCGNRDALAFLSEQSIIHSSAHTKVAQPSVATARVE